MSTKRGATRSAGSAGSTGRLRRALMSGAMGLALLAPAAAPLTAATVEPTPRLSVTDAAPVQGAAAAPSEYIVAAPNEQVPSGYEQVAETNSLRLHINRDDSKVIVEDKRSGKIWTSNPLQPLGDQKTILDDAVFQLNHTNARRQMTNLASSASERPALTFQSVPGGVRVGYDLQKLKIKLTIDYVIKEEPRADVPGQTAAYLEVTVPNDGLKEEGDCAIATSTTCAKLVSLEVLPMFGAAPVGTPGYLFVPDGVGSIVNFKSETAQYRQRYSQQIYGTDVAAGNFQGRGGTSGLTTRVLMPLFGLKRDDTAYAGIVTKGEFQANVNAYMAGYITNANRASVEFIYRRQASIPRRKTLFVNRIEDTWMPGDRQVRFYLLNGDDANYAGIGKAYRNYLMKDKGVARLPKEPPRNVLTFYQGITRRSSFREDMVVMTTFDQAIEIAKSFVDKGITNLDIQLYGWNDDGDRGRYPRRYPAESDLGGNDGLRRFTSWAKQNGVRTYLYDDYGRGYVGSSGGIFGQIPIIRNLWPNWSYGFNTRFDTVRGVNLLPVAFQQGNRPGPWTTYLLNPVIARERYARRDLPIHKQMGADGVVLSYARFVQSDTNTAYPLSREGTAEEFLKTIQLAKETVGDVMAGAGGSSGANGLTYIFRGVNRVLEAPELALDAFGDQPVPVYHIATQGLITRYSWAPNLRNDQRTEFLRMVEYGMYPEFWLTHQPAADLIRTTNSWLYSTEWNDWVEPAAKEMKQVRDEFGALNGQFVVNHEIDPTTKDVHRVTYEDGTQFVVNHASEDYNGAFGPVSGYSYVLRRGGTR
jgi:hypothetical protein